MSPARRRPAALRVVTGVALVVASGLVVVGTGVAAALDSGLAGWTIAAVVVGVLAVACGAAAVRLTHSELMAARRRAAADRAELARDYAALAERRDADHRRHTRALQDRIDERAAEAIVVVAELEQQVADLRVTLAAWEAAHSDARTVLRSAV